MDDTRPDERHDERREERRRRDENARRLAEAVIRATGAPSVGAQAVRLASIRPW